MAYRAYEDTSKTIIAMINSTVFKVLPYSLLVRGSP